MDALYPRLLVRDFPKSPAFYQGVLRDLLGVEPVKVLPGYANWDIAGEAGLVLFDHAQLGIPPASPSQEGGADRAMLVMKVDDVEKAAAILERHGATMAAPPQDRPAWGPTLRTAHLRDPEGTLIELQSY
ncbi:VOC family protein [Nonomuraea sp. N2-4H]|uniref:VOC family protein n=1 Tax=Nonomuraea sp. N2-4H TaxID=3128898 RepID=UPI0032547A5C